MLADKTIIVSKIHDLKHEIDKLRNMDFTPEQIIEDEDIQDMADRRMQVAIENCMDIATHLAAGLELPRQEYAADVFRLLGKNVVISEKLANSFTGVVGLRNILVHEYAKIDYKLAYSDLDEKLKDLEEFAKEVLAFLEKQK